MSFTLSDIDKLVDMSVKHYKEDWYDYDRPRAEKDNRFLILLRPTGVDCLFFGPETSYNNMLWIKSAMKFRRERAIYHYNNGALDLISRDEALKLLNDLMQSCPDEYIKYCDSCDGRDFVPSLQEWKQYNEEQPQVNIQEWLQAKLDN